MDKLENEFLEEVEKQIETQVDSIEIQSEVEFLAAIKPKLKKKRRHFTFKNPFFMKRVLAIASSLIVVVGVALTVWLTLPDTPDTPNYRYEDSNIVVKSCEEKDITAFTDLYLPNLNILINTSYMIGEHKESHETIYFKVDGVNIGEGIMRHIALTIILQEKYEVSKEEQYNTNNKITISDKAVSVLEGEYDAPFYNYKLGFKIDNVRYYMDYQTTSSENDIADFLSSFLIK